MKATKTKFFIRYENQKNPHHVITGEICMIDFMQAFDEDCIPLVYNIYLKDNILSGVSFNTAMFPHETKNADLYACKSAQDISGSPSVF